MQTEISRQQRWQQKRVAEGKCRACGEERDNPDDHLFCSRCRDEKRERDQIDKGSEPWREGGRGRPPKYPVE